MRRLLVPMLVAASAQLVLSHFSKGANGPPLLDIFWLPVYPYEHYWFLQAIFLIFTLVALLDSFGILVRKSYVIAALTVAAILAMSEIVQITFMASRSALYLLPFFLLGLYFGRFGDPLARPGGVPIAVALLLIGLAMTQAGLLGFFGQRLELAHPTALLFGASFCMLIMRTGWTNAGLEWIGKYSYSIYLFHMFGVAPVRAILPKIGIDQPYPMFFIILATGLLAPVAVELIAGRFAVTRVLLLGQKPSRKRLGSLMTRKAIVETS